MSRTLFTTLFICVSFLPLCFLTGCSSQDGSDPETGRPIIRKGLIGYWKLQNDCKDYSGTGNHGINHGVSFAGTAGQFNGIDSYIEIPESRTLDTGSGNFSIAARVYTEEKLTDVLGDIISKYDPVSRRGFNFTLMNFAGTPSSQSNFRNVLFGIDDARSDTGWTDCGRPGRNICAFSLTVYQGDLYAGTFEWGEDEAGHVYRYAGDATWIDCGSPDKCTAVMSMAVYDGKLYAGVSRYDGKGSGLKKSPNAYPGGKIYRYEGGTTWTDCGKLKNPDTGESDSFSNLVVFNGRLYATPMYQDGRGLYRYEGRQNWVWCGMAGDDRLNHTTVYNGSLYASSYNTTRGIFRYDNPGFTWCGNPEGVTQTYGFMVYRGGLFSSTWPNSEIFRYAGGNDWVSCGGWDNEKESMGMAVYNGKLYAGSLPLGKVYRYEGGTEWTDMGSVDKTPYEQLNPPHRYRRAWSMAVYNGKLFCGVLPSGRVKSFEAGKSVTLDDELAPGWRHLTAVRDGNVLKLYIDGQHAAESSEFHPADYDISNGVPLQIGFGQHDYFNGKMTEVRLYNRALSEAEAAVLYDISR